MDPAELAVFFPFLFLELPNPNLWPAEGAGPTLNLPENGHGYPPRLKVAEAVPSLHALLLKVLGTIRFEEINKSEHACMKISHRASRSVAQTSTTGPSWPSCCCSWPPPRRRPEAM
jgi:hypothetical protein